MGEQLDYYYARKIQNQDDAVYAQHDQEDVRQERMAKQMLANEARVAEQGRLATARMIKDTQFRNNLPGFVLWAQSGKDKLSDQDLTKLGVPQHLLPGYQQQLANAIRPQHSNRPRANAGLPVPSANAGQPRANAGWPRVNYGGVQMQNRDAMGYGHGHQQE